VFSLSSAAPHLFGDRLGDFERDLRGLLRSVSPAGRFAEKAREIELSIWSVRLCQMTGARSAKWPARSKSGIAPS
jgi:hypothetical protein